MFQFTRNDEDGLWVIADTLAKNKQFQEAKILIKFISEKAFAMVILPSDIVNIFSAIIPSQKPFDEKLIKQMQQLNEQIRDLTKRKEDAKVKLALLDYVDMLCRVLDSNELRKKILVSLIDFPSKGNSPNRTLSLKSQKAKTSDLEVIKSKGNKVKRNGILKKNDKRETPFVPVTVETYAPKEAAEIIGVSAQTVRRMCENGKFPEATKTYGGHWRIPSHYFLTSLEEARAKKNAKKDTDEKKTKN